MSLNRWVVKLTMMHSYLGTLRSNKKEWTIDTYGNKETSSENYVKWKKPISKGYILDDSTYTTFLEYQNYKMENRPAVVSGYEWLGKGVYNYKTVLYLDCGGGYMRLPCNKTANNYLYTYTQTSAYKPRKSK